MIRVKVRRCTDAPLSATSDCLFKGLCLYLPLKMCHGCPEVGTDAEAVRCRASSRLALVSQVPSIRWWREQPRRQASMRATSVPGTFSFFFVFFF
jgi:hypothetical protein